MANIFTIGQSALAAAQAGISTAGQNIANVSTPGYSRQGVVQTATTPQPLGFGYLGQGTQVTAIRRIYSDYLGGQVVSAQSSSSQLDAQYSLIQQIDNMLADPSAGLSPAMQDFFNSLQDVSTYPADAPARQAALSSAQAMASRFRDLHGRLEDIRQGMNLQITDSVKSINSAAQQLVALNRAIDSAQSVSNGAPANDLLDQRDRLVSDLSKQIKVTVTQQRGQYSVSIGNGQPLVTGASFHTLKTVASRTDPSRLEVAYDIPGQQSILTSDSLAGGALGGLLEFRSQTLEPAQNALGRVALGLASAINDQQQSGYTRSNVAGGNFFNLPAMRTVASSANQGQASISAALTDAAKLTSSDYRLQFVDGQFSLTRLSDNTVLKTSTDLNTTLSASSSEGFSIALSGSPVNGDEFLIRPTAGVAGSLSVAITNTNDIAAASSRNSAGDNSNILKMIALQTGNTLNGGNDSYQSAYAQLVNQVGSKTAELAATSTSAATIRNQAQAASQNVSGVNLDEEAANLIKYQQAYQAAGKVLQLAKQMFDSLIASFQ
ncbi:MAG: flagellar hook-associated protein FlgK [Comamonadaceae bacterium]